MGVGFYKCQLEQEWECCSCHLNIHCFSASLIIGKDSDPGRDWGQEEKGTTENETAGWHHRLDGCGFEWTPGVGDGQGGLPCCNSWGRKQSDITEWLNWTELSIIDKGVLTFPTIIVDLYLLSVLSFVLLIYFDIVLLGTNRLWFLYLLGKLNLLLLLYPFPPNNLQVLKLI